MKSKSMRPVAAAAAGVLCGIPLAAGAQQVIILPGYEVTQNAAASASFAGNDSVTIHSLGSLSHSLTSPAGALFGDGTGSASGSVAGTPSPLIAGALFASLTPGSVPAGFEPNFVNSAAYQATLLYSMEVLGPTPTAQIQFHSLAQYATGAGAPGTRFGAFVSTGITQMDDGGGIVGHLLTDTSDFATNDNGDLVLATGDVTGSLATGFTGGYDDNGVYTFLTNTRYLVSLQFQINMDINGFGGSDSFSGFVDPTFAIAPGSANAGAYSFVFSDGISNGGGAAAAPEPAAWTMMLLGFGALGALARRRRARAAPAA
jgi:hypothetical protein